MEIIAVCLLIAHVVVGVLWILPSILAKCLGNNLWWVSKQFCSILSISVYMLAVFIACASYP